MAHFLPKIPGQAYFYTLLFTNRGSKQIITSTYPSPSQVGWAESDGPRLPDELPWQAPLGVAIPLGFCLPSGLAHPPALLSAGMPASSQANIARGFFYTCPSPKKSLYLS